MSAAPGQRIQRSRARGWRMPENAVYVGRGSHLGNPFRVYPHCTGPDGDWGLEDTGRFHTPMGHGWATRAGAAAAAVAAYRRALDEAYPPGSTARTLLGWSLHGKDLACWCPLTGPDGDPFPCHADILLALAAETGPAPQDLPA